MAVDLDLDLVEHLERAEERGVRLDAPVGLLERRDAVQHVAVADLDVERERVRRPEQRQVALHGEPAVAGHALDLARLERDALLLEHFLVDRLIDVRLVVLAERLHAAGALDDAQRGTVDLELEASSRRASRPTSSTASQAVTWSERLWPAMAAAPPRFVRTISVPSSGPSRYAACRNGHERSV